MKTEEQSQAIIDAACRWMTDVAVHNVAPLHVVGLTRFHKNEGQMKCEGRVNGIYIFMPELFLKFTVSYHYRHAESGKSGWLVHREKPGDTKLYFYTDMCQAAFSHALGRYWLNTGEKYDPRITT